MAFKSIGSYSIYCSKHWQKSFVSSLSIYTFVSSVVALNVHQDVK